jgi:hypothetical protein
MMVWVGWKKSLLEISPPMAFTCVTCYFEWGFSAIKSSIMVGPPNENLECQKITLLSNYP